MNRLFTLFSTFAFAFCCALPLTQAQAADTTAHKLTRPEEAIDNAMKGTKNTADAEKSVRKIKTGKKMKHVKNDAKHNKHAKRPKLREMKPATKEDVKTITKEVKTEGAAAQEPVAAPAATAPATAATTAPAAEEPAKTDAQ